MNIELQQAAAEANRTFNSWKAQMKRDNITKPEMLTTENAEPARMTVAARALWVDHVAAQGHLNAIAKNPSQPVLELDSPESVEASNIAAQDPPPAQIDGIPVVLIDQARFTTFADAVTGDSLGNGRPKAKVIAMGEGHYVAMNIVHHERGVMLAKADSFDDWGDRQRFEKLADIPEEVEDFKGLVVTSGRKKFVLTGSEDRLIVMVGDPLAAIGAGTPAGTLTVVDGGLSSGEEDAPPAQTGEETQTPQEEAQTPQDWPEASPAREEGPEREETPQGDPDEREEVGEFGDEA